MEYETKKLDLQRKLVKSPERVRSEISSKAEEVLEKREQVQAREEMTRGLQSKLDRLRQIEKVTPCRWFTDFGSLDFGRTVKQSKITSKLFKASLTTKGSNKHWFNPSQTIWRSTGLLTRRSWQVRR
jgi:hypothetical protein